MTSMNKTNTEKVTRAPSVAEARPHPIKPKLEDSVASTVHRKDDKPGDDLNEKEYMQNWVAEYGLEPWMAEDDRAKEAIRQIRENRSQLDAIHSSTKAMIKAEFGKVNKAIDDLGRHMLMLAEDFGSEMEAGHQTLLNGIDALEDEIDRLGIP